MRLFVVLLALLLVAGLNPAGAADAVRVRAAAHEPPGKTAYGRIVFDWPSPVAYKASIETGKLVVRFDHPFAGRLDVVKRYLRDYVLGAEIGEEGRTVSFPLKAAYRLKTYADGATIVLDLVGGAPAANPPKSDSMQRASATAPAPKPSAATNGAQPVLPVRTGDHAGFGRLVFDWTRNVDYTVKQDGNRATVRFSQPAMVDYAVLARNLPRTVTAAQAEAAEAGTGVILTTVENARLRHFRNGTRVVLDVLEPTTAGRTTASVGGSPSSQTASANRPPPSAAAIKPSAATPPPVVSQPPATSAAAPPANLLARPLQDKAPVDPHATPSHPPAGQSLDEVLAAIPGMAPPRKTSVGAKTAAAKAAPQAVTGATTPARPAEATKSSASARQVSPEPPAAVVAQPVVVHPLGTINELTGLRIVWPQDVAAAVYERAGYLWLMFDRRARVEITGEWPRIAAKPQMIAPSTNDVTLLRWPVPAGRHPALRRDGNDWIVDMLPSAPTAPTDIKSDALVAAAGGPKLMFRGTGFAPVRDLRDPEVGDRLWVVPLAPTGRGTTSERRLAELQVLGTLQGLVIKPLSDGLAVRNVADGIEVSLPGGLHLTDTVALSQASPRGQTPLPALAVRSGKLFDFAAWSGGKDSNFFDRKGELQRLVIDAPKASRNAARLALARFFFAHGLAADTLGILKVIEEDDDVAVKDPAFRSLRGAGRYLAGDYAGAGPDLFDSSLDREREAALWRGALLASQNDWLAASRYFAQTDKVLANYPTDLQLRFGLLAAECAFMTGDTGLAKYYLDALASLGPARVWRDQIDYLKGRVLAKANDIDAAAAAWDRVVAGVHRPSRVKAQFARADMLLASGRMTSAEAITEFERLRYAWRGDDLELAVLKRLGELYIQTAHYRTGLQTLREAMTYFPKSPDSRTIDAEMRAAFAALYVGDGADKLPPLAALSLYEDFRDLTPAGEAGDVVASKLVDRLVSVELLDRAADVLKQQIETRLTGAALAEAVNRLGVIYLLAHQPEQALAVLGTRMPPETTPTAVAHRRQLKARTLGELTRYKDALVLIEGDDSRDADRLRAEIGWRTQNWQLAAYGFGRLVPEAGKPLTDADRQTVLRLAIAQSLASNSASLKDLRKHYGAAMAQSAFKESFDLVTAPGEGPAVDLRAITRQVTEVDQFRAFLTSYRDKLLPKREAATKPASAATSAKESQTAATN